MSPVTFYKSLADDTRLKCLLMIQHEQELCVCELTEALDESQPKISRHLAQLRKAEILTDRRQGQWIYYQINPALAEWAREIIAATLENNLIWIEDNLTKLSLMGDRPKRKQVCCR